MTKEQALKLIILDYCSEHNLMPIEFARKCELSKSYISKIINEKFGSVGISLTYLERIANGLNMKIVDLQNLIDKCYYRDLYINDDAKPDRNQPQRNLYYYLILSNRHNLYIL